MLTGKIFLFAQKWEIENYSSKGNESQNHYLNSGFIAENIFQPQLQKKKKIIISNNPTANFIKIKSIREKSRRSK